MLVDYIKDLGNKYEEALNTVPYSYELNKWQLVILQEATELKKRHCISRE